MIKRLKRAVSTRKAEPVQLGFFDEFWGKYHSEYSHGVPNMFYRSILCKQQRQDRVDLRSLYNDHTYNAATKVRFVCTSDTHNLTDRTNFPIPYGDVLLHAGDFTQGESHQVAHFTDWLDSLPHPIKIVIAGNHERFLDATMFSGLDVRSAVIPRLDNSCVYLEDSTAIVHGIRIFGSPWSSEYIGAQKWGFELQRGSESLVKWSEIPNETDILLTHGPAVGHGDRCLNGLRQGCVNLLQQVQVRIKPKFHVSGDMHEDYGATTDGQTTFINSCMCNEKMKPVQHPVVFDMDKKSDEMLLISSTPSWTISDPRQHEDNLYICRMCGFDNGQKTVD